MAILAVRVKIMPTSPQTDLTKLKDQVAQVIGQLKAKLHATEEQPIAFGLRALICTIAWPEEEGTEKLEQGLSKLTDVRSAEVVDIRRAIG